MEKILSMMSNCRAYFCQRKGGDCHGCTGSDVACISNEGGVVTKGPQSILCVVASSTQAVESKVGWLLLGLVPNVVMSNLECDPKYDVKLLVVVMSTLKCDPKYDVKLLVVVMSTLECDPKYDVKLLVLVKKVKEVGSHAG